MSETLKSVATSALLAKATRNVDNTVLNPEHKQKLQSLLTLLEKTWDEDCVLPLAILNFEESQKKAKKAEKKSGVASTESKSDNAAAKKPSLPSEATSLGVSTNAATGNTPSQSSNVSGGLNRSGSSSSDDTKVGSIMSPVTSGNLASPLNLSTYETSSLLLDEEAFLTSLAPTKGKLQPVVENHAKPTNPLHLAAKISTLHKDFFSPRCLIRFLWANKWVVEKAYQGCLNTVLWRHQNLPQYWTEEEIRSCVRMRYMDWYGTSAKKVDPATGATVEVPCAILHLRAVYSDLSVAPEARCKFVLLALEKGVNYMRRQFHDSQKKVLAKYAAERPNEPFRFVDERSKSSKKDEPPRTMDAAALKVLTEEIQGVISEAQRAAAAAHGNLLPAEDMVGEDELLDGSEQLIMVMDETDSSSDKIDTKFLRFIAPILFSHYVERLRYCIVINPTFVSSMCVNIIKLVVDERTKSKLKLIDVPPVPMDEWLAEQGLRCPGREPIDSAQFAALRTPTAANTAGLTDKDREKREKEYAKEREKRAKKLANEDLAYPSQEVISLLGIENTPMRFGGTVPPMTANQYESWFNAMPPFSNPAQCASEAAREARRVQNLK